MTGYEELERAVERARRARSDHRLVTQRCSCGATCPSCVSGARAAADSLYRALMALDDAQESGEVSDEVSGLGGGMPH